MHVGRSCGSCSSLAAGPIMRIVPKHPSLAQPSRLLVRNQLGDELLDFLQAGKKMRKWYGAGDMRSPRGPLPEPGKNDEEEEEEEEGEGDAILVTDIEGAVGEQVLLQLILARATIRVLVKDVAAAKLAFGPYVTPIPGDVSSGPALRKALKGAGSVVAVGKLGALPQLLKTSGVSHAVLLSTVGSSAQGGLLGSLFQGADAAVLADERREAAIKASGVPFSIVRSEAIKQIPGGQAGIALQQQQQHEQQGGSATRGNPISCEDLAAVLVATLRRPPTTGRVFKVMSTGPGQPPEEWSPLFNQLEETPEVAAA